MDYSKKKVAELEEILKSRSLPHSGKKADLVARLQEHDAQSSSKPTKPAQSAKTDALDDQIDWEDDTPAEATTAKGSAPPATAAIAAGGQGQIANPALVPNQVVDTEPSKTNDLSVKHADDAKTNAKSSTADTKASAADGVDSPEASATDFTSGIASTALDAELEKRKKRAARFGLQESAEDAAKALERAKRFGTGSEGDQAAVKGLDEALPERTRRERGKKRGRDDEKPGGDREGKRRATPKPTSEPKAEVPEETKQRREEDNLAAENRKKRFATATA